MRIYEKFGRFLALKGKVPLESSNWRINNFSWQQAQLRLSRGINVGFIIPENCIVIDVDPRNGGLESYEALLAATGMPDLCDLYPTVITGSGGLHIYGQAPQGIKYGNCAAYPGIDIKSHGGYVVTAGSTHPETKKRYEVFNDARSLEPFYEKVLDPFKRPIAAPKKTKPVKSELSIDQLAEILALLDVKDFDSNDLWFPILAAAHTATAGQGESEFVAWSLQDPKYEGQENFIRSRWRSLHAVDNPITSATLFAALDPDDLHRLRAQWAFSTIPAETVLPDAGQIAKSNDYAAENDLTYNIARAVLQKHKIISGADGRFWIYSGTHWRPIGRNMIAHYIYQALAGFDPTKSISTILSPTIAVIEAIAAVDYTPGAVTIKNHSIINVQNGEIWIDDNTGDFDIYPHAPESGLISCLPIRYNPAATCPRFDKFLNEIFIGKTAGEVIRHLLEILGYVIQNRKNIATWVLFHGRGANGKTVLLSILSALLGEAALEKPIGSISVERNNHALADLPGKLAIIDDDVSANTVLPDGELKSLSENKWLTANPKGATPFRFRSCAIPILSANGYPVTRDLSNGLKRRAMVFEFFRSFAPEDQDPDLADYIINNEISGVLNACLAGLGRLRRRKRFQVPQICQKARNAWYNSNNPVALFKSENLIPVRNFPVKPWHTFCTLVDAYDRYLGWTAIEGMRRPQSRITFRVSLESAGIEIAPDPKGTVRLRGYTLKKLGKD